MYSLAVYMEDPCLSLSLSLDGLIRLHVDYEVMISAK